MLTLLTAFFLFRYKKGVLPRTHGFINALIWLTFQTAAPGAVWYVIIVSVSYPDRVCISSLISLVISQLSVNGYQLLSAFNEILPKLYAVSMMWTLNARHELRNLSWGNSSTISRITTTPRFATKPRTETVIAGETVRASFFFLAVILRTDKVTRDDSDVELRPFDDGVKIQRVLTHVGVRPSLLPFSHTLSHQRISFMMHLPLQKRLKYTTIRKRYLPAAAVYHRVY